VEAQHIARVVIAIAVAVALAVLGAHPRVLRWERRFGLTVLATSGFPFFLLGLLFRELGVLTADVVADLRPLFEFGLGWVGLTIGMNLNLRRFDRLSPTFAPVIALVSLLPIVFVAIGASLTLSWLGVLPGKGLIRDALILMACAAVSAPANVELLLRGRKEAMRLVLETTRIDNLAALALLAVVAILFRPDRTVTLWYLPRSGWFLMTLGLGALLGIVIFLLVRNVRDRTEELALLLGGVALAAGMAGYLALAVAVVCAIAGAVLVNLPLRRSERIVSTLRDVERPLYFLFLFIVGAGWRPDEWEGWLLGVAFAVSRGYGKIVAVRTATWLDATLPPWKPLAISLLPESTIAIVVLFSASAIDPAGNPDPVRWAVNAVIVGSVLTEVVVQTYQRRERRRLGEETLTS
jgi:Sodium/hydrogen exchanger family